MFLSCNSSLGIEKNSVLTGTSLSGFPALLFRLAVRINGPQCLHPVIFSSDPYDIFSRTKFVYYLYIL